MTLTDILPIESWIDLERKVNQRFGLNAYVFDKDGIRITDYKNWANKLCPAIKTNENGQSYICAVAHENIAAQAIQTRKPVVGECDAGLVKVAIPIFAESDFIGVAGGCGRIINGSEVESFLVNKITGIEEWRIRRLSEGINRMETREVEAVIGYIQAWIDRTVSSFEDRKSPRAGRWSAYQGLS